MGLFTPCAYFNRLYEIDIDALERQGVRTLLLDADNTITTWNNPDIDEQVLDWFARLHRSSLRGCIISNNSAERLQDIADDLGLPFVAKAKKPLPFGFWRAIREMGGARETTMMVGDQLFTDVLGARLAGLSAILLEPISTAREFRGTRINRMMERVVKKSILKKLAKRPPRFQTAASAEGKKHD